MIKKPAWLTEEYIDRCEANGKLKKIPVGVNMSSLGLTNWFICRSSGKRNVYSIAQFENGLSCSYDYLIPNPMFNYND